MNFRSLFNVGSSKRSNEQEINLNIEDLPLVFGRYAQGGNNLSLSVVFAATEMISNSIAQMPIYINSFEDKTLVRDHPVMLALQESQIGKFMMIKNLIKDVYLSGNGFIYIKRTVGGQVSDLIYLHPGQCNVMYNDQTRELYYLAPTVTSKKIWPKDIIHVCKNSIDGINGRSVTSYANRALKLADFTESAANNYYSQGCNINGVVKSSKMLTDDQKRQVKENWIQTFGGSTSAGGVCVLGVDMDYTPIGSNAAEAQLIESRQYNITEICRYFNIDPRLLGYVEASGYNTLESVQLEFLVHTLQPLVVLLEEELNRKLLNTSERDKYFIELDESVILRSDKNSESQYYTKLVAGGILTVNEAREALGYGEVEGGDKLILAYSNVNNNTINGDKTSENDEKTEEKDENSITD